MSEYHAALGHAELDNWKIKRYKYKNISELYKKYANKFNLQNQIVCGNPVSLTYCLYLNKSVKTNLEILNFLNNYEIGCRTWYGDGLHNHPAYRKIKRTRMNNTSFLANNIIGLPMHTSLKENDIEYIVERIAKI